MYSKEVKAEQFCDYRIVARNIVESEGKTYHGEFHFAEGFDDQYWSIQMLWNRAKNLLSQKYDNGAYFYSSVTILRPNNRRIVLTR
jgi:hypothetical protein